MIKIFYCPILKYNVEHKYDIRKRGGIKEEIIGFSCSGISECKRKYKECEYCYKRR